MHETLNEYLPALTVIGSIIGGYVGVRIETAVLKSRVITLEHSTKRAHERIDAVYNSRKTAR